MSKQNTNVNRISISAGNTKMGAIRSFSLPPILTCPNGCPCAAKCYAAKICRLRPAVRAAYQRNYDMLQTDPGAVYGALERELTMSRHFRFHVSGDFYSAEYFAHVVELVRNNPACNVLAFTKQFDVVNAWIDNNGPLPENFKLIFSEWGDMAVNNPHKLPQSAVIFKGSEPRDNWAICPGNCFECACRGTGCWTLKSGETIAFYEH